MVMYFVSALMNILLFWLHIQKMPRKTHLLYWDLVQLGMRKNIYEHIRI